MFMKCGVKMKLTISKMHNRFGIVAARIFKLLLKKKFLEDKQIIDEILVAPKIATDLLNTVKQVVKVIVGIKIHFCEEKYFSYYLE